MADTSSEEGQVIDIHNDEEWNEHFNKGAETKKLLVVNFTASWCGPCRLIAPFINQTAREMPHVIFLKVDVDELQVVVDFTASWCGPCRFIAPILADIAKKMTHVMFFKVDVDELKTVAEEWRVEAMPTFVFIKEGKVVDRVVGANKDGLLRTIEKHSVTACEP